MSPSQPANLLACQKRIQTDKQHFPRQSIIVIVIVISHHTATRSKYPSSSNMILLKLAVNHRPLRQCNLSFKVGSSQSLHHTSAFAEARAKDAVRVLEHAVLQTDDDELRALEPRLDQTTDILRM